LFLCTAPAIGVHRNPGQTGLFAPGVPRRIVQLPNEQRPSEWKTVVFKNPTGNDTFASETGTWNIPFRLGPDRSALENLPADETNFPAALWVRQLIMEGVHRIQLNADKMRAPCPAGSPTVFLPDGSNLPWIVHDLEERDPDALQRWLEHVRT
jgi:hypothetical protein